MRDFSHHLDERLQRLVITAPPAQLDLPRRPVATPPLDRPTAERPDHAARRPRRSRAGRARLAGGGLGGVAVVAASAVFLTGTSAAGLPILHTPISDASAFTKGVALGVPNIQFTHAHVVSTSGGTAAVMTIDDGKRTCMAIPDPVAQSSPVGRCAATAGVERAGLLLQAQAVKRGTGPAPRGAIAFILPIGAQSPRIFDGTEDRAPSVADGVVLSYTNVASHLRYRLNGRTVSIAIPGPFDGETGVSCDGSTYTPTLQPGSNAGGQPGHLIASQSCATPEDRTPPSG